MIKNAICKILGDDATLTAIVDQFFPVYAPQGTDFPFVVVQKTSTEPTNIKSTASTDDIAYVQIDMYAVKQETVQSIASRIRTLLDQYSGTIQSVTIENMIFEDEEDGVFDIETEVFAKSQDYRARIKN